MRRITPFIKVVAWILTLVAGVVVFGVSSSGTFSLLSERVKASVPTVTHVATVADNKPAPIPKLPLNASADAKVLPAVLTPTSTSPAALPTIALPQMTVTASVLNIHSTPGGPVVGVLDHGSVVSVVKAEANWAMVTAANGVTGWAYLQYLSPN
jgi:hypothetical protein